MTCRIVLYSIDSFQEYQMNLGKTKFQPTLSIQNFIHGNLAYPDPRPVHFVRYFTVNSVERRGREGRNVGYSIGCQLRCVLTSVSSCRLSSLNKIPALVQQVVYSSTYTRYLSAVLSLLKYFRNASS